MKPRIREYSDHPCIRYLCQGYKGGRYACAFGSTMDQAYSGWLTAAPAELREYDFDTTIGF